MSIDVKNATKITLGGVEVTKIADTSGNELWNSNEPLCFTSTGVSTIKLKINGTLTTAPAIYYSFDNINWHSFLTKTSGESVEIQLTATGKKLYLWNKNSTLNDKSAYIYFVMTGSLEISGKISSLINYGNLSKYCYNCLFKDCTVLTNLPYNLLPATTLAEGCYLGMFSGCTSLANVPDLPATTLAGRCYQSMFNGCTGLTIVALELLEADTLSAYCYYNMFTGCTALTTVPELPATKLERLSYANMFYGCSNLKVNENGETGTAFFTCPETIPSGAVDGMFTNTGGTFTGTPTAGNTYKWYN